MKKTFSIFEKIGPNAISMSNGDKIREFIEVNLDAGHDVALNFDKVSVFATPFFNASIGTLLKDRDISVLQKRMEFLNLNEHGRKLLNLVIDNAIKFYSDKNGNTKSALDEVNKDID